VRPLADSDDETEPLPSAKDLAAFAKDPALAERILGTAKESDGSGRPKPKTRGAKRPQPQPVQSMRPSDMGSNIGVSDKQRLARLLEINKAINTEHDLGTLLDTIMDAALELSSARRGFLVLWDRGEMQVARARNIDRNTISTPEAAISRHLIREAIDRRETVVTAQASTERNEYASATGLDLKSVMVSPLIHHGRIIGALYLDEPDRIGVFHDDDIRTVEAFCDQAAIALLNARRMNELETRMESQRLRLRRAEGELRRRDQDEVNRFGNLVTSSPKLKRVFDLLGRVAETAFPVIIQGESGTGKELLAKAIHYTSLRRDEPFVAMNCAAVPETLLDSELFGYQAGAFTGAVRGHKGLFEQADKGSLFLDEVEEMSPAMQGKLLRVLQEGEVRRVGGKSTVKVDVRVIAATNRDIQEMVEKGEFRRDLYYRLNVIPVNIPPLRERMEDLDQLISDLLTRLGEPGVEPPHIGPEAIACMRRYPWPGNVRELENELKRLNALGVQEVTPADLSDHVANPGATRQRMSSGTIDGSSPDGLPTLNIKEIERLAIDQALKDAGGNKTHAAKVLGLSRRGLLKKLERYREEDLSPDPDGD
jgi:transcriptional regulator with GAF, ATPase, and Fis domain